MKFDLLKSIIHPVVARKLYLVSFITANGERWAVFGDVFCISYVQINSIVSHIRNVKSRPRRASYIGSQYIFEKYLFIIEDSFIEPLQWFILVFNFIYDRIIGVMSFGGTKISFLKQNRMNKKCIWHEVRFHCPFWSGKLHITIKMSPLLTFDYYKELYSNSNLVIARNINNIGNFSCGKRRRLFNFEP